MPYPSMEEYEKNEESKMRVTDELVLLLEKSESIALILPALYSEFVVFLSV